jgi:hypothetical protein
MSTTLRTRYTRSDIAAARKRLTEMLPRDGTVYVILRSVSASGMLRRVSVVTVERLPNRQTALPRIVDITGQVALALDWGRDKNGYLAIGGAGFSVATHVIGALGWALYGDEYALKSETL